MHRRIGSIGLLWNRSGCAWLGIQGLKGKNRNEAINSLLKRNMIKEIARFEPVLDKKNKLLIIKNWWWEQDVCLTRQLSSAIREGFEEFMKYIGASKIKIASSVSEELGNVNIPEKITLEDGGH